MNNQEYTLFGKPIEKLEELFCEKCSELLRDKKYRLCYNCSRNKDNLHFEQIRAPGIYRSRKKNGNYLSNMIRLFKYGSMPDIKRQEIAEEFSVLLYQYVLNEQGIVSGIDCLVPVPITKEERGVDHAKMIAEKFSEKICIRIDYSLVKIKGTKKQTSLKRDERCENVKGAFGVMNPKRFKGKKVLLIDDVVTTCSTVNECAKVLKKAGAKEVTVLALARDTTRR
jgi:ComF family protein